ncbi:MAG: HAMP domain-containing sensor histidine kinase [Verrucomicrobia bacterium]|nr:HAMP domain-containing sensor histidine kinase [Verrucomicrobiota bacterium]
MNKTALAFVLTAVALAVPSVSWFIVGSREVATEATRLEEAPRRSAEVLAERLADRLGSRLETLREAESRRPFYHYQNLYHDPKGAYEGAAVIPSPLAQGPADPLVRAHFQIDAAGRLTLPTLNDELLDTASAEVEHAGRALQLELQPVAAACLEKLRSAQPSTSAAGTDETRMEVMSAAAYEQNLRASRLYASIKNGKPDERPATTKVGEVRVRVGPFHWHTVVIGGTDMLVALREVQARDGMLAQGFVIDEDAITELLRGAKFPTQFLPGPPSGATEAAVPIAPTVWHVSVFAGHAMAVARNTGREAQESFIESFTKGVIGAAAVGLCVVALVWWTDRLARQRSHFAAAAAHELRTPLTGLRMYAEMLAEGLGDPTRSKDYARRIAGEVERLGRVVANVLGFTRLERGTLRVRPEPGDLATVVRECIVRQQAALEAAGARVETALADDLSPVRFDRDAVAEILENLLDNAEKYSRTSANRAVRVTLARDGNTVVLAVSDHGPGVSAAIRRRLFRPFARGGDADSPVGLGLGLALVQALARAHDAKVGCDDAPGGGAVFTVKFPIK